MKKTLIIMLAVMIIICTGCQKKVEVGGTSLTVTQSRQLKCPVCHGDGVCYHCGAMGFNNGRRCSVCNGGGYCNHCGGAGALEVMEIDGRDYTICGSCQGDGKCDVCNGSGSFKEYYSNLGGISGNCMLCQGSGNCLSCHGSGLREVSGF